MLFNSLHFLCFFLVVVPVYFGLPHKARWAWLLGASCYFYMVFVPAYILILAFTIIVDYAVGLAMAGASPHHRRYWLWCSIVANMGILVSFKYLGFFSEILASLGWVPAGWAVHHWLLPIGLSFHTLQALSYTIEVYYGRQLAERHLGIFALYVLFFPQLVAGPIERPQNMLHQFRTPHIFQPQLATAGLRLILWGLFKKVVIADRLATVVDLVYDAPGPQEASTILVATLFFTVQIFCDFSGYTDIARGTANVLGFRLMENFDQPYAATSITEFWRRWHLSLSTWLRDYVYVPLGGNRNGLGHRTRNIAITFVASGLWHGASFTFVVWGLVHAFYQWLHLMWRQWVVLDDMLPDDEEPSWLSIYLSPTITFVSVMLAWVFFRAHDLPQAFRFLGQLATGWNLACIGALAHLPLSGFEWVLSWAVLLVLPMVHVATGAQHFTSWLGQQSPLWRTSTYYALALSILFLGQTADRTFIYFQF